MRLMTSGNADRVRLPRAKRVVFTIAALTLSALTAVLLLLVILPRLQARLSRKTEAAR